MSRPEYIACIADGHADNAGKSWCGRHIRSEFHFVSIDHAAISGRNENRLVACSECTAEIKKSLSNGQVDTTPGSTLKVMRGQDDEDNPIAYMRNEGEPNNLVKCTFACPGAFGVYAKRAL